jgi:uncharacterized protein
MKRTFLVDINHPAHVHLFRHLIAALRQRGDEVVVTASLKEINYELLRKLGIDFIDLGSYGNTAFAKLLMVPVMAWRMWRVVKRHRPQVLMGMASSRICHATVFNREAHAHVFTDTENAKEQILLFRPFASRILTPDCFTDDLGPTQLRYPSYHELAYLHPDDFTPDPSVLAELDVKPEEPYFVLRFVSWTASHDIGQKGLSLEQKEALVDFLSSRGRVFISSESVLPASLEPYRLTTDVSRIHHVLYFATVMFGESATMASESAVLGTHAFFIDNIVRGYTTEQEQRYGLVFNYDSNAAGVRRALAKLRELLDTPDLIEQGRNKRRQLLWEKVNLNRWMLNYFDAV